MEVADPSIPGLAILWVMHLFGPALPLAAVAILLL